jgi:hypothetical protein
MNQPTHLLQVPPMTREERAVELLRRVTMHPRKIHPGRPAVEYGSVWQEVADEVDAFLRESPPVSEEEARGKVRNIELGEPEPAWGAAKDQAGVFWLTCHGNPILNLDGAFKRAATPPAPPVEAGGEATRWGRYDGLTAEERVQEERPKGVGWFKVSPPAAPSPDLVEALCRIADPEWERDVTDHTEAGERLWDRIESALAAASTAPPVLSEEGLPSEAELFPELGKRIVAEEVRETLLEPGGPMAAATNAVLGAELTDDTEQACGIASQILGAAVHNAYGDGK